MRRFEEYLWRLADWNLQPAPEEARVVEKVTKKPCLVVPNGVDFGRYRPVEYLVNRKTIMYLGTLVYPANAEAVKFFLTEVYPKIKRRSVDVRFILVSSYEPRWLGKFLRDKSIEHVKDATTPASELFGRADVLVAPMRIASGTNIKILEAMAAGLPVVTTTVGAEGLAVQNGVDLIVVDGAQQMGEEIIRLLGNNQLRRRIGQRARELVRARYTWSKTTAELRRFYRGIGDAQN
jgi:glycosyltransferase involved in cell wall biosynthesis